MALTQREAKWMQSCDNRIPMSSAAAMDKLPGGFIGRDVDGPFGGSNEHEIQQYGGTAEQGVQSRLQPVVPQDIPQPLEQT